jgi:cell fate (sporulation/competence/biofilm development) regulator YlbF (YheA/YmcA/DUF963 family)
MDNDLKEKLDNFIDDFLNVPEVKQYLLIKKEIETSEEIKRLNKEVSLAQKEMALSLGTPTYEDNKKKYEEAKALYDNHPLIVNYSILEEEVSYLINEIKNKLSN